MQVSGLFRYPIKGCRGHALGRAEFDAVGVVGDRRLMLVDGRGRFVSQREMPALAALVPMLEGEELSITSAARPPLHHRLRSDGETVPVRIWNDTVPAVDQGDAVAGWFHEALGAPVRLVRWTVETHRRVDPRYSPRPTAETTFTDAYPALGVLEASLADLNRRLAEPVPMERFRPTIVLQGGQPWDEDHWGAVTIGDMTFDAVKPCARCVVTTTDQRTGHRHPEQEPLRTLAAFRSRPGWGTIFGQNLVHRGPGEISVGEAVRA